MQRPIPMGARLVDEQWFVERRYEQDPREIAKEARRITISGDTSKHGHRARAQPQASGQRRGGAPTLSPSLPSAGRCRSS